jgi:glycosyltransferase involved in cell wall biosynthesis
MSLDVLLPFHRVDRYLYEAINSLKQSTGPTVRLILIDDRADRNADIIGLTKILNNTSVIETQGACGYGEALRVGTTGIESDSVALFNSDDLVSKYRFSKQVKALESSEICITNLRRISALGSKTSSVAGSLTSPSYDPILLLFGSYGANATWCMRSEWWLKSAFFDGGESLDWRIGLEKLPSAKFTYLDEPLYFYRKHKNQITASKRVEPVKLDLIYSAWCTYLDLLGIASKERGVFEVMATPWLSYSQVQIEEIKTFVSEIGAITTFKPTEVRIQIKKLIQRRMLLASRNLSLSKSQRLFLFKSGWLDTPSLIRDVAISLLR